MSNAIIEPMTAPAMADRPSLIPCLISLNPCLLKFRAAMIFCISIATLFEAFAAVAGRPPNIIRRGIVRKEPPPAFTLTNPAAIPARKSKIALIGVITYYLP